MVGKKHGGPQTSKQQLSSGRDELEEQRLLPGSNLTKTATTLIVLVIMLISLSGGAGAQERAPFRPTPDPPEVNVEAWALVDGETGLYLTGENADEQLPVASTTKIMSALVALEEEDDLDEEVTVSREAESYVGLTYSNIGLIAGERVSVRDLLAASLIPSGTDAVYALAEHLGGGSVSNFVGKMNAKASSMGLENTRFDTPAGLDTTENYSSARELAEIAHAALQYPLFAEIVDTRDATIHTQDREIEVHNTNQLLTTYPPATGVKTGTSPQAGANLVASAEAGDESYIAVVLGADDDQERFRAAQALLEYAFDRYEHQTLVSQNEVYDELPLPYRRGESVELTATKDVSASIDPNSEVERRVTAPEPPPEAQAGQELGEVEVFVDGESAGRSPLVAREGYEEASLFQKAWYGVGRAWDWVWSWVLGTS